MANINILVLGGHKSGKTCFMLGMYDDMRVGYGGFTFRATDGDVGRKLVERFGRLLGLKEHSRWPVGTDILDDYEFSLNFALRRFMLFNWYDYRGGIISETGEPYHEVRELTEQADMVMICAPGALLYRASFKRDREAARSLLIAEIQQLMVSDRDVRPSVTILVTKFDEFAGLYRNDHGDVDEDTIQTELLAAVRRQYQTFFAAGGGWRVMVCPVSLGPKVFADPDGAEITPQNMHLPVMFAYHEHARDLARAWAERISATKTKVAELTGGFFGGRFTKGRTREALADLATLQGHQQTVQSRISIIVENLPEGLFFDDGAPRTLSGEG